MKSESNNVPREKHSLGILGLKRLKVSGTYLGVYFFSK